MNLQATPSGTKPASPMSGPVHPDLKSFLAAGDFSDTALDDFVAGRDLPLIEPGAATYLWRGDAHSVSLLRWIHAGVDRQPFFRVPGSRLWLLRLPVEDEGRFEYKLGVDRGHGEDWMLDPLNPNRAGDPFGENSVTMTAGYERPAWSLPAGNPTGEISRIEVSSTIFGTTRTELVYIPPGYDPSQPHPLVVIHDGGDYQQYAGLSVSLDNLIATGDIPPLLAVLIEADDRMDEYPKGRRHARYVVGELLPTVAKQFSVSDDPRDRILLGASLGAVASLVTAFRYPGVFAGLILKSGSFILDQSLLTHRKHPVFHRVARVVRAFHRAPALPPTRAFVSTGELEGLAKENRALAEFLQGQGVDVLFQSSWDGHHWHNWRDQLRDGLMWVLRRDHDDIQGDKLSGSAPSKTGERQ